MEKTQGFCQNCGNKLQQTIDSFSEDHVIDIVIIDTCFECGNQGAVRSFFQPSEPEE